MEDKVVSLESAKLLSSLGFDWLTSTLCYIDENGLVSYTRRSCSEVDSDYANALRLYYKYNKCGRSFIVPTQSLAQKWLMDEKDINVFVTYDIIDYSTIAYVWNIVEHVEDGFNRRKDVWDFYKRMDSFGSRMAWYDTYEEALEAGLIEGLGMISSKVDK